ncbi:MAG TPA: response regulator [Bryobacteraceae bacterium]|jgi:two-component system cell cycle sensor histidine kinase/response regulator CckA|nr:response regulator [Bryobacteraceae bacterium]
MFTAEPKKQVLVVEDEALIAADIQKRLERLGYSVPEIAASGEEALRFAGSTPFDLILMDIRLNGKLDGIATANALKENSDTPVVYMTAHADQETIRRARLTQPFGYILKPITDDDLSSAIEIGIYKHEMDHRVRESEAWLSTTLRSIGDAFIATDTAGKVVFMNSVAEQLTGVPAGEAQGRAVAEILDLYVESTEMPAACPAFDSRAGATQTYTLISRAGPKTPIEIKVFENRSADLLLGSIAVVSDISARREWETRLTQSQRMEAIANLAGGLAHDFNNQLGVILGLADLLCSRLSGPDLQDASAIRQSANLSRRITRQLLTLSRHDPAQFELLSINDLLSELEFVISYTLGEKRTVAIHLDAAAGFVYADRNQLMQVLLNLAINARDAMPQGGQFRIETSAMEPVADSSTMRVCRPGMYARIRISDTGDGMDKETLLHIFEPFFTTKKPGFGTGFGLSIVHSIVTQSGGYITASSEPGEGATFEILLPRTRENPGDGAGVRAAGKVGVQTILLVDDEDGVRHVMQSFLRVEGYQTLEARDAAEAESIAQTCKTPIHLLITDVLLPGVKGPQLAERLKRLQPDMRVLFVSGYPLDSLETGEATNPPLLLKPFAGLDLIRSVRKLLAPI